MSVRIQEINVKNLGPIDRFSMKLGIFNLIYGRNEKGKTYLVEFLVKSLFRNPRQWKLREIKGSGKVTVQGLNGEAVEFSPSRPSKMEDFLEKSLVGLPADFSKLLVIKGAEVDLASVDGGVDKTILKHYLSSQKILDLIDSKIDATIRKAKIENGMVVGDNRGSVKSRGELKGKFNTLNNLFLQINQEYSGGKGKMLHNEIDQIKIQIEKMEKAKAYKAFQLDQEIKELEKGKENIDEEKLQQTRENISVYWKQMEKYKSKVLKQEEAKNKSEHYQWLENALDIYQSQLSAVSRKPDFLLLIPLLVMFFLAVGFALYKISIGMIITLIAVIVYVVYLFKRIQGQPQKNDELKKLETEFKNRFQIELTGLPQMKTRMGEIKEDYDECNVLKKQLVNEQNDLESLKAEISHDMVSLSGKQIGPEYWKATIDNLQQQLKKLNDQIQDRKNVLARLAVDPSDYVREKPDVEYSRKSFDELIGQFELKKRALDSEEKKLNSLKQEICVQTGDKITEDLEMLMQNAWSRREKVLNQYKSMTASIIGENLVHHVLEELRQDEDKIILDGLQSDYIIRPLKQVTGRYNSLRLEKDQLKVSDDYKDYPISDLSTGAQEQVLLALRIGFASKLLGKENLFLILDDAFQYSDWERREWLMDMMVDLAQSGWQIIYFTMDDHIKELFESRGERFGDQFKMCTLKESGQ